jgi:hypothetical protein
MAGQFWLGPPGALVNIRAPSALDPTLIRKGGTHELLAGGTVRDTLGYRRRFQLEWQNLLTTDELAQLENLYLLGGPLIFVDPSRRNLLTANQSTGSDFLDSTDGAIARFGGTLSSSTAQARSGTRSFAWAVTPSSTGWGIYLQNSTSVVDASWTPVKPSTQYTVTGYMRSTAAISMKGGMDWYDKAGAFISADIAGSGQALNTGDWNIRVTRVTPASPATAAYGIPWFTNTTTGSAMTVFLDDPQMEEAAAATVWVQGTGTPRVIFDSFSSTLERAWDSDPRWNASAVWIEA